MIQTVLWFGILVSFAALVCAPMITTMKDLEVPLHPGQRDRCPVCGMFVYPYPEWISQVRHSDGSTVFFDGCKDLFKYLLAIDRYAPEKSRTSVTSVFVTNYYDGEVIAARTALFVVGSDVLGPMGSELVAHRSREAAADFMKDHGGFAVFRFDEINEGVLRAMD